MVFSIIGGGLAGCEAALWLADKGGEVRLHEQKPLCYSPAHKSEYLAELVCSNSFKADRLASAAGLLKAEMRKLGSHLLPLAGHCRVPAGGALAVDRERFSAAVTRQVMEHPGIRLVRGEVQELAGLLKEGPVLVASGPLTQGRLAEAIIGYTGQSQLSFYDAAAPIVTAESLDRTRVFSASRYGRGEEDYLNCPFDKAGYESFLEALLEAEGAPLHDFDQGGAGEGKGVPVYEGCMPVEVMARRGKDTLRFGPLRPVGLRDPKTGHRPWANVQLRREDAGGSLYNLVGFQTNLKFGEQKRVFQMIPGLENAEFVRYGVMHRNTFLNSPQVLNRDFSAKEAPGLFFAGQITGFEGYMESAASALLAARALLARAGEREFIPPGRYTMCGALAAHITTESRDFQPMGANMGLLPPLEVQEKNKQMRYEKLAQRALEALSSWEFL